MTASFNGHIDVVQTLIEAKAQINTQKEDGWTALHLAAHEGKVDVVRLLTEAQALVNNWTKVYIYTHYGIVRCFVHTQLSLHTDYILHILSCLLHRGSHGIVLYTAYVYTPLGAVLIGTMIDSVARVAAF